MHLAATTESYERLTIKYVSTSANSRDRLLRLVEGRLGWGTRNRVVGDERQRERLRGEAASDRPKARSAKIRRSKIKPARIA
jgi:hypothetical protein